MVAATGAGYVAQVDGEGDLASKASVVDQHDIDLGTGVKDKTLCLMKPT